MKNKKYPYYLFVPDSCDLLKFIYLLKVCSAQEIEIYTLDLGKFKPLSSFWTEEMVLKEKEIFKSRIINKYELPFLMK